MPVTKTPSNVLAPPIEADQRAQALQLIEIGQIRAGESAEAAADIGRRRGLSVRAQKDGKEGHRLSPILTVFGD
jgi:hypothetical protein